MVHTASYSYWGTAIDITFDDVDINGGRPRILDDKPYCTRPEDVCNSFRSAYVSGNKPDPEPPTGDFTNITNGQHISSSTPVFSGWGADVSSGFGTAQLLAAPQNGTWQVVGPAASGSPFNITPDLCQSGLPPGPTALGLRLMDTSGFVVDMTGLRWVTLDFACSPPPIPAACIPGAGQAALFDEANYQGTCKLFNPGGFVDSASLSPLGGGRASSILLGAGTRVTLYTKENFSGRAETIISSDSNLADNRIQNNSAYSLFVRSISDLPFGSQPFWPPAGQVILDTNSLTLYWLSNEGDMQYQVELTTPAGATLISPWLNDPWWNLADGQTLKAYGIYSWRVRSRFLESLPGPTIVPKYPNHIYLPLLSVRGVDDVNAGPWSSPAVFIYTNAADTVNIPVTQEYFNQNYGNPAIQNEGLNGHWTRTGEWKWENTVIPPLDGIFFWYGARPGDGEFNYANAHSGSLTTVPITMTSDMPFLRFWYYYDTEIKTGDITRSSTRSWDQRWVQISVNNPPFDPDNLQPFVNLYQLSSEPGGEWQESPLIRLPAVTGQVIRLRFYFDTIDGTADGIAPDNFYQGWFIDDVKIVTTGAGLCTDDQEPDNSPHLATLLSAPSQTVSTARICPEDLDYYAFYGSTGEKVSVDINPRTLQPASKLDSVVELFDSDGKSVLAYNDDYSGQLDSYLTYQLPRTGLYFIRVHHYDIYDGGNNYYYELKFVRDGDKPQVTWLNLGDGGWVPKSNFPLSVQALDGQSGVDKVEFFMHNSNWSSLTWQSLGQASGSNGNYSLVVDPDTDFGPQANMAFFVRVTDKAGNISVRSVWNLVTDFDLPTANLAQLDGAQQTNVYQLSWSGADATSGLDHFELQRQVDGGTWEDLFTSTLLTTMWDVVPPGHTYAYRMRSVDRAGNASPYQNTTTVVPDAETLCALSPDPGEVDNIFEDASPLPLGQAQSRSFCNPVAETEPDLDWIRLEVQAGEKYWVIANPQPGSPAAPVLALYGADKMPINPTGTSAPASVTPGAAASLFWIADRNEEVRIRIENADPSVIGAKYSLLVFVERSRIFLPSIGR